MTVSVDRALKQLWKQIEAQAETKGAEWKAQAVYTFLKIRDLLAKEA